MIRNMYYVDGLRRLSAHPCPDSTFRFLGVNPQQAASLQRRVGMPRPSGRPLDAQASLPRSAHSFLCLQAEWMNSTECEKTPQGIPDRVLPVCVEPLLHEAIYSVYGGLGEINDDAYQFFLRHLGFNGHWLHPETLGMGLRFMYLKLSFRIIILAFSDNINIYLSYHSM
ncbi:hypothetical protein ES703_119900 [subsurface metagenome]